MKKLMILLCALSASLSAADFSGIWNGKGGESSAKYGTLTSTAQMTLVQAGSTVTGTFKFNSNKVVNIASGAVSGTQVSFLMQQGSAQGTARLSQSGAQLVGTLTTSTGKIIQFVFSKQ